MKNKLKIALALINKQIPIILLKHTSFESTDFTELKRRKESYSSEKKIKKGLEKYPEATIAIWLEKSSKIYVVKIDTEEAEAWLQEQKCLIDPTQCLDPGCFPKFHIFEASQENLDETFELHQGLTVFPSETIVELPDMKNLDLYLESIEKLVIDSSPVSELIIKNTSSGPESEVEDTSDPIPTQDEVKSSLVSGEQKIYIPVGSTGVFKEETEKETQLVLDAIIKMRELVFKKLLETYCELGKFILEQFYENNYESFIERKNKRFSLRRLAEQVGISHVLLSYTVRVHKQIEDLKKDGIQIENIGFYHHMALLKLKDDNNKKIELIEQIREHNLSVQNVKEKVSKLLDPTPTLLTPLDKLNKLFTKMNTGIGNIKKEAPEISQEDLKKIKKTIQSQIKNLRKYLKDLERD